MQPSGLSSLIFVVIIGVWAAYFIQYWVRRREHLATARSVDQFSESMRVLERRSLLPTTELSEPRRESYAVSPARPSRPSILVKRAEPAERVGSAGPVEDGPHREPSRRPAPPSGRRAAPSTNRAPGLLLLTSLVALVAVAVAALLAWLPLWSLIVPVASLVVAFGWVRHRVGAAGRERVARARAARPRSQSTRATRAAQQPVEPMAAEPAPAVGVEVATDPAVGAEPEPTVDLPAARPYDIQAVEAPATAPPSVPEPAEPFAAAHLLVDEDDIPLTWDPVPVPRPTYTMKARATRPAPPAADLVGDADTEYAAPGADQVERRAAGA